MTPPIPPRQSLFSGFFTAAFGLALTIFGAWILYGEMRAPVSHDRHFWLGVGLIFVGALIIVPGAVIERFRQVVVIITSNIPIRLGGKRSYDPPADATVVYVPPPAPTEPGDPRSSMPVKDD